MKQICVYYFHSCWSLGFLSSEVPVLSISSIWLSDSLCRSQRRRLRFRVRKVSWRRKWQPTPVFFPGKSHGQRSLAGYSPWGHKGSDMTEQLSNKEPHAVMSKVLPTHGQPLNLSCNLARWSQVSDSTLAACPHHLRNLSGGRGKRCLVSHSSLEILI